MPLNACQVLFGLLLILCIGRSAFQHSKSRIGQNRQIERTHSLGNYKDSNKRCSENDSYCGDWDFENRTWKAWNGYSIRDVSSVQANKCVVNKTIACIGDSQTRDFCIGLGLLLANISVNNAPSGKFDKNNIGIIRQLSSELRYNLLNRKDYGLLFPKSEGEHQNKETYQIQIYSMMYTSDLVEAGMHDLLERTRYRSHVISDPLLTTAAPESESVLRPIDFIVWNHGLHDQSKWYIDAVRDTPDQMGEKFYNTMLKGQYLHTRLQSKTPMVWMSMNNECYANGINVSSSSDQQTGNSGVGNITRTDAMTDSHLTEQALKVNNINAYLHKRLHEEHIPYFDAASVTRCPQRCKIADSIQDIVHLPLWMEIVKAKLFLNLLCDEDFNWVGDPGKFM